MKAVDGITKLTDILILIFITIFLLTFFKPELLFLKTTINGGDTGSHYPNAVYLKEVLLPQGKTMGWMPGNYAGFPLFYHYFPLPFLLMIPISLVAPLEVAFKLVTVTGIFLLPFCVYGSFRMLRYPFPIPVMASLFSLVFLFNQGNSMWGGNIPSTLAGEFCYSLGLAGAILLLGTLYRGVREARFLILNAVLIAVIGISHAFPLIFSLMIGSYFLVEDFRKNYVYIFSVYTLGLLLIAFWLLPLLGNLPYSTSFSPHWTINSYSEIFPNIMIPLIISAAISFLLNRKDERTVYFAYLLMANACAYILGPHLNILDIRFIPFLQLLLVIFSATFLSCFVKRIKAVILLPFIFMFLTGFWINANTTYIRQWISWNYTGYEQKNSWKILSEINLFLSQTPGGRVAWEHTPADEALGSLRTSEILPYFARRQTLEGIHMLGAVSAPFIFYIQSETSFQPCNPLPEYFYSTFNLKTGIDHFKLFNVDHFVVRSAQVKKAIAASTEFKLEKTVGDYHIYRLLTNSGHYVEPLVNEPIIFKTDDSDWRNPSYQWFSRPDNKDVFLIFTNKSNIEDRNIKYAITDLRQLRRISYRQEDILVRSNIDNESIDIETSELGHPLLIKVSYHPNWRVEGADRIYLASPAFMLIFPNQHRIRLHFSEGALGIAGKSLSFLGLILLCSVRYWAPRINKNNDQPHRKPWRQVICITVIFLITIAARITFGPDPSQAMNTARRALEAKQYEEARVLYQEVIAAAPLSSGYRNEASFFFATALVRQGDFSGGAKELRRFILNYPTSFWTPQAWYDLAYCEHNLGQDQKAANIYHRIILDFPATTWATYARDRLKEMK